MMESNLNVSKLREILLYELKRETKCQPFFSINPQDQNAITFVERDKIVSNLLALNKQFGFHPESFALAANILDRFLYLVKAQKKYLPCIGVACFFLAIKMVEEEEDLPGASEVLDAMGCSFSVSDLLRMERIILAKLEWELNAVTPLSFLQAFHALSVANGCVSEYDAPYHLQLLTKKMELLICRHESLSYKPSTLALALLIQDLHVNASLRRWIHLIQRFQAEIKVAEWELNGCFVAVCNFLDFAYMYHFGSCKPLENKNCCSEKEGKTLKGNWNDSSSLICALALETKRLFESAEKISTHNDLKVSRMLSAVA